MQRKIILDSAIKGAGLGAEIGSGTAIGVGVAGMGHSTLGAEVAAIAPRVAGGILLGAAGGALLGVGVTGLTLFAKKIKSEITPAIKNASRCG